MEKGDDLKTYSFRSNGLFYYTKKPYIEEIKSKERLFDILHSSQRIFVIFHTETFDRIKKDLNIKIPPVDQAKVGHWNYVLISNKEDLFGTEN